MKKILVYFVSWLHKSVLDQSVPIPNQTVKMLNTESTPPTPAHQCCCSFLEADVVFWGRAENSKPAAISVEQRRAVPHVFHPVTQLLLPQPLVMSPGNTGQATHLTDLPLSPSLCQPEQKTLVREGHPPVPLSRELWPNTSIRVCSLGLGFIIAMPCWKGSDDWGCWP